MHRLSIILLCSHALVAGAQEQRLFKDWVASCDNTRHCTAIGLSPVGADEYAHLRLERAGAPEAEVGTLRFELLEPVDQRGAWSLWQDERHLLDIDPSWRRCGAPYEPTQCAVIEIEAAEPKRRLFGAFRQGDSLTLVVDDRVVAGVSLAGASAALLWIDEQQRRLDTPTAFVRKGDRSLSQIPPPPRPPEVRVQDHVWRALDEAEVTPLLAEPRALLAADRCDDDPAMRPSSDRAWALPDGRLLAALFCYGGAYNYSSVWFFRDRGGSWREYDFPRPDVARPDGPVNGELVNAEFVAESGVLNSFSKGRGFGDCGVDASWGWDGERFVLLEARVMNECRGVGPESWPVLYRSLRR